MNSASVISEILRAGAPMAMLRLIERAASQILAGELVAIPTETVYGLAADATSDRAVAKVFQAKGRPAFNPLIIHVTGLEMARRYAAFSPLAEKLAAAFWPGPLTLVLPRKKDSGLSLLVSAGLDAIALRAPNSVIARQLIEMCDRPLAAPSANRSGSISPTTAEHVRDSLGDRIRFILDGGPCRVGVESTIVKIDGDRAILLRPGGTPRDEIERLIGKTLEAPAGGKVEAPGMMASHYAPSAPLRLNAEAPRESEAFLGFGAVAASGDAALNLSEKGDLVEAAANLFSHLRRLDALCAEKKLSGIAAAPIPMEGLGEAINDRLARAAAPKT
ncbi:MAG TPA: L-threonylcarbamoyladenylate synthase [Parvularculaceae bacterium]|nr:L-threonylcarbamoyladenylate synthase [Parvularculaceae bacterium]